MPKPKTGPFFYYETVVFYRDAPEHLIDKFESLLDEGDEPGAKTLIQQWFDSRHAQTVTAGKKTKYTEEPPQIGDMVVVMTTGNYARLIATSDDKELALVKEQFGAYVVPYDKLIRAR